MRWTLSTMTRRAWPAAAPAPPMSSTTDGMPCPARGRGRGSSESTISAATWRRVTIFFPRGKEL
jgi:hypothetical protein